MPRGKKYAPKRKLIRRKRLARRGYRTNVNRGLQPIAQRSIIKMKYAEAFNMSFTAGVATQRWNLNSIFDPNRTGTGHQPYGHDTFQTLYNRYRVIGCKYNITWSQIGDTATNQTPIMCGALPANEEHTVTTMSELRELPRARYLVQHWGAPAKVLSGYVSIPSLTGRTKAQYMADDRYQAQFGANPNESAILNTFIGLPNDASPPGTIYAQMAIELTYLVECFDVKVLAQS